MNWTDEQQALFAIDAAGKLQLPRVAVTADAGSGKTTVLSERVRAFLGSHPGRILCVSFTEKSAADLESKLFQWLNVEVYTIHGFCARVVQEFGPLLKLPPILRIMDQDEALDLFHESFQKVYRRIPPKITDHPQRTILDLCLLAREKKFHLPIHTVDKSFKELEQFIHEVLTEFEILKTSMRAMDYSDLEFRATELLKLSFVSHTLQKRYGHVFVDEFQDTSQLQCQLIESLVGSHGHLFVVGDFKQSIYRFRGADVEVFRKFVNQLPEQRKLSKNFRSYPEIIDAINQVCAPTLDGYQPMQSGRIIEQKTAIPNLPRVSRVVASTEADGILKILNSIKKQKIDWSQAVLLLPRIRGNEKILKELENLGVGLAVTSAGSGNLEPGLIKLVNLWIWACEPWLKLRAARVLTDFNSSDVRSTLAEKIEGLHSPYKSQMSCEELLASLEEEFNLHQKFGVIFSQFSQFILNHQNEGLLPVPLARRFARLTQDQMPGSAVNSGLGGLLLLPPPPEFKGMLRVMTIHAAKGLEFPIVILADLKSRNPKVEGALVTGEGGIWIAGRDDAGKLLKWDGFMQAVQKETQAQKEESARLLYVAMTRARDFLFVVDTIAEDSSAKSSLWEKWIRAGIPQSLSVKIDEQDKPSQKVIKSLTKSVSLEKDLPSYTRSRVGVTAFVGKAKESLAAERLHYMDAEENSDMKQLLIETAGIAKDIGTAVHKFLEYEDWSGLKQYAQTTHLELSSFFHWLSSDIGQKIFGQYPERFRTECEFAFEWNTDKEIIVGQIDRLVVFKKEAWVIDYKVLMQSSDEKKRSPEELLSTYSPQLKIYTQAIQKLLSPLPIRAFILDVTCATDKIWHEVI